MLTNDPDGQEISLLYVEDEPDSREMLSEIIRYRYPDVQMFVSENGEAGLESFKQYQPEIVITDINLPITNGIKMAAEIKSLCPSTEIIALTAHTDTSYLLQAIEIGISHYILKPIDIEQIFSVIDKTLTLIRSERVIELQNNVIRDLNTELAQKAAELEMANRELESFDYTVAHDLRSPMVTIRDISQRLLDVHAQCLDNVGKGYLQTINRECIRMDGFINALLRFSMQSRKNVVKKWTSLSRIAHEILERLLAMEPRRHVKICITEGVSGYCDPTLIRIILENLLGNAWKFSTEKEDACIEFGTINTEEDLVYFVRDNGSGFEQEESEKVFTTFQRLQDDDKAEGFGIGLATVYRIIQRHGGRVWGEGEKGKGATFFFTL
jgi:signal transduction histidine kinase